MVEWFNGFMVDGSMVYGILLVEWFKGMCKKTGNRQVKRAARPAQAALLHQGGTPRPSMTRGWIEGPGADLSSCGHRPPLEGELQVDVLYGGCHSQSLVPERPDWLTSIECRSELSDSSSMAVSTTSRGAEWL